MLRFIILALMLAHLSECTNTDKVFRIVSRNEWQARPPAEPLDKLNLPVHRVIIAHTATTNCTNQTSCISLIQRIQNFQIDEFKRHDIAYNFLVGGDGLVYEGRGWDLQGAHTRGYNVDSIGIAFVGTFVKLDPPEDQLNAAKWIIEEGVRQNKLVPNYTVYGARQLTGTESPGAALYEIIKHWPNWSNKI